MSCSRSSHPLLVLVALCSTAAPARAEAPLSVAVLDIAALGGIDADRAALFGLLLQDHLRNALKHRVIGRADIEAMLGLERMKDILACQDDSTCMSEIGGALGVDELVVGSLGKLGSYLVISVKRISPTRAQVLAQATRTLKGAGEDELVEAVAPLCAELFALPAARPPPPDATPPVAVVPPLDATPPVAAKPPPASRAEARPAPELRREPPPPVAEGGSSWPWLAAGVVLVGLGVALDLAPDSAHNERLDALDLAPLGLYGAGITAVILGVF